MKTTGSRGFKLAKRAVVDEQDNKEDHDPQMVNIDQMLKDNQETKVIGEQKKDSE